MSTDIDYVFQAPAYDSTPTVDPDQLVEMAQAKNAFTQANLQKINPELAQAMHPNDPIIVAGINSEPSPADVAEGVGHALTTAKDGMPMKCEATSGDALGFGILLAGVNEISAYVDKPELEEVPVQPTQIAELDLTPAPVPPSYDMPNGPYGA